MTALSERGIRQVVGRKHRVRRRHRSPARRGCRLGFESLEPRRLLTWAALVYGIDQVMSLGAPGALYDMSGDWMPIVGGDDDTSFPSTVVLARASGDGRVVAFGDDGFFVQETPLDNGRFLKNVTDWLDLNDGRQVRYTTGHNEVIQDDRVAGLAASLAGDGYSINALPGEITAQSLAATSVLIVGNAWQDFTSGEIQVVRQFVESGGGLWLLGLGWSWVGYHPDLTIEDYPMMKLAAPYEVRWLSSGISDPTNHHNGLPIFHTFYPEVPSLFVPAAVATIRDIHEAYPVGLPAALEESALLQRVYTEAHRALWFPTSEFAEGHAKCQDVYDAILALVMDYPESYARTSAFDETLYPTATWARERLWWTWRDCLPLTEAVVQQMVNVGQLSANYASVLQEHGVIILDNLKLGAPQVDFIDRYLDAIPAGLHNLRTILSLEHMGVQPAFIPLAGRPDAVGLGWTIGLGVQNQFPDDVAPIWGDYFVLLTAHEINHVVDAFTIGWDSRPFHLRRSQLIADAGDEPMNYLRSMVPAGLFTAALHEFFASISNQWFCNSAHTVRLGLTRFDAGRPDPINQALFFADVYSQGGDSTWFYQIDLDGNITREATALRRDEQGRIVQLQVGDDVYRFKLNHSDNVIAYSLVDDNAGITVLPVGSSNTTEAGGTATFTAVLDTMPTADVTLYLNSSNAAEGVVWPATLTFTPANWNVAQTAIVTGVDDLVVDGDVTYRIAVAAASLDLNYDGNTIDVSVTNLDNDVAGFTLDKTTATVSEPNTADTVTVALTAAPLTNVVFSVASGDPSEVTVAPGTLTFTPADWNVPQTVTLTAVDDTIVDGPQISTVTVAVVAASSDDAWDWLPDRTLTVTTLDNDGPGFILSKTIATVTEPNTADTVTVMLTAAPLTNVVFSVTSGDPSEVTVTPGTLTFTPADWNVPQTVTLTAVDDMIADGPQISTVTVAVVAASSDDAWDSLPDRTLTVTTLDNDGPGLVLSKTTATVSEPNTADTVTVMLTAAPLTNVVFSVTSGDPSEVTVTPGTLTFTPADWNVPQTVTLTAVDDTIADGPQISTVTVAVVAASSDDAWDSLSDRTLTVTTVDDDEPGFVVSPTEGLVTSEAGGTATFTVRLTSQPAAEVTVGLSSSDPGEGTVSPASLTFTAANWDVPQTVTVTGEDDPVVDGPMAYTILTAAAVSGDANYAGLNPADVPVINLDDDVAGVTVVLADDPMQVTEGDSGWVVTYTMVLRTQPASAVTIAMIPDDQLSVSPGSLMFTAANWNVPQTVTATAVDDALIEGPHAGHVTHAVTSGDAHYDGIAVDPVTVEILDNDVAGFEVVPASGLITTEAGGTATFMVRLTSQPTAAVSIGLSSSDPAEGTVAPATLTFLPSAWNIPQTATVTGVDDPFDDGDVDYTILTAAAVSADVNFHGVDPVDVSVTNRNDDTAGVAIVQGGGQTWLTEGWSSDAYSLALTAQPRSDVVIAILPDNQLATSPASLTFTADNWNLPQVVRVWAVNDSVAEGPHSGRIDHAASSGDAGYDGISLDSLVADITDNDTAGFVVDPDGGLLTSEAGDQATFTIHLTSQPTDDVIVGVSSSDPAEGTVWPATLVFTAADWNMPQTVTVTGVDDEVRDGDQVYTIVVAPVTSGDAFYHGLPVPSVGVTNLDDDLGWQNRPAPCDVNGDGDVTALDVLIVINYINARGSDPSLPPVSASPPPYYDVNDDGLCTAGDVLEVINFINRNVALSFSSGEGSADSRGMAIPDLGSAATLSIANPAVGLRSTPQATWIANEQGSNWREFASRVGPCELEDRGRPRALDAVWETWEFDELEDLLDQMVQMPFVRRRVRLLAEELGLDRHSSKRFGMDRNWEHRFR